MVFVLTLAGASVACAGAPPAPKVTPRTATAPTTPPPDPEPEADPTSRCGDTADGFDEWLAAFGARATADGISMDVARRALGRVTYDREVIELDRAQAGTRPTFEEYVKKRVTPYRLRRLIEEAQAAQGRSQPPLR